MFRFPEFDNGTSIETGVGFNYLSPLANSACTQGGHNPANTDFQTLNLHVYRERGSNPHGVYTPTDFKSVASTYSAIPAWSGKDRQRVAQRAPLSFPDGRRRVYSSV